MSTWEVREWLLRHYGTSVQIDHTLCGYRGMCCHTHDVWYGRLEVVMQDVGEYWDIHVRPYERVDQTLDRLPCQCQQLRV